jgi:hypothetical protein
MPKRLLVVLMFALIPLLLTQSAVIAQTTDPVTNTADYIRAARLGITFISSAQIPPAEAERRYQHALELGAGWNRFPIYWDLIEATPGEYDWSAYDRVIADDLRAGLGINAILLGIAAAHRDGDRPAGLNEPIFADGTDNYREGKTINPDNPFALFVWETVQRYRPGGTFAVERGLGDSAGIRVWEIWNEPDFEQFWSGGVRDYARLLKTAYIVIKAIDPEAQVMFGGLIYNDPRGANFLAGVMAILINDPLHEQNNWYFDMVAVHNYNYAWRSGWLVRFVRETLRAYDIERPIWLNESGAAVWDDYPGPTWETNIDAHPLRTTQQQQAWFFIQSTAYAWVEGADVVFFHQLYDDCGNQPAGTDFPPHDGSLCAVDLTAEPTPDADAQHAAPVSTSLCYGDAFGIYRNEADAICFRQHPEPGTARPVAGAFRLMAEVFGHSEITASQYMIDPRLLILIPEGTAEPTPEFTPTPTPSPTPDPAVSPTPTARAGRPQPPPTLMGDGTNVVIRFNLANNTTVYVLWNETTEPITLEIPAQRGSALVRSLDGDMTVQAQDGTALSGQVYRLELAPAVEDGYPFLARGEAASVGGSPLIVIESAR